MPIFAEIFLFCAIIYGVVRFIQNEIQNRLLKSRVAQLEKDNDELRTLLISEEEPIESLLTSKMRSKTILHG